MEKEQVELKGHILVTGGAGYIGSSLVPMLLDEGFEVTVYDVFLWGIKSLLSFIPNPKLHITAGDIRDKNELKIAMLNKDIIVHLAGIVGYPACEKDPINVQDINIIGTRNVVELLGPEQKVIFASTGSCYDATNATYNVFREETDICALTVYGKTKAEAEKIIIEAGGISLRLATVFGLSPRFRHDLLINDLTYKAIVSKNIEVFDGSFCRSFLHVRDAARAFVFSIYEYDRMRGQAFNIGDDKLKMTKIHIAKIIQQQIEDCTIIETSELQQNEHRNGDVSYEKIKGLGYRSTISIEQGIKEMLKCLPFMHPMGN